MKIHKWIKNNLKSFIEYVSLITTEITKENYENVDERGKIELVMGVFFLLLTLLTARINTFFLIGLIPTALTVIHAIYLLDRGYAD